MIVTVMGKDIFSVNAKDGKIIWKVDYAAVNAGTGRVMKNHAITPIFKDGCILIANGYNWVALKLKLIGRCSSVETIWKTGVLTRNTEEWCFWVIIYLGQHTPV